MFHVFISCHNKVWCFQNPLNKCVLRQKNEEIEFSLFYQTLNTRIKTSTLHTQAKAITFSGILLA